MKVKRIFQVVTLITALFVSSLTVQAQYSGNDNGNDKGQFKDVKENHWAYPYVQKMAERGIISGYDDGLFHPNDSVSREQFSKMMVLTLGLDLINPKSPFFEDVKKNDWSYKYVETARRYLTGFHTDEGEFFRPKLDAVREDMAVAIVLGLGLSIENVDESVLDDFKDKDEISNNLLPYVAKAVKEGIMIGDKDEFNPQKTLTRAEAATLLARLIDDEKVVYDEEDEKVIYDDPDTDDISDESRTPTLEVEKEDGELHLDWSKVDDKAFVYYNIVFSEDEKTPVYPEDGYLTYISDVKKTEYDVEDGNSYNGGDIDDGKLQSGKSYYISITAVYNNGEKYYPSNTIHITLP